MVTPEEHLKQIIEDRGKYHQNLNIPFLREEILGYLYRPPKKELDKDRVILVLLRYLEFSNKSDYDFIKRIIDE